MAKNRSFFYDGRGRKPNFTVETKLTDMEAIDLLTNGRGIQPGTRAEEFTDKCAFAIYKMANGFEAHPSLIAWGFKIAEDKMNPIAAVVLAEKVHLMVRYRAPLKGVADGDPYRVSLCGPRSQHAGKFAITDGGSYGDNKFYGYAVPVEEGGEIIRYEWRPTRITPDSIKAALAEKE